MSRIVKYRGLVHSNIKFYDFPAIKPNIALNGPGGTHTYAGLVSPTVEQLIPNIGGIDEYTKAMLHFDADAVTDECGNTWNTSGSPSISASPAKFDKALQLNGSSYIYSSGIALSNQPFTIDFWAYPTSSSNSPQAIGQHNAAAAYADWIIRIIGGKWFFQISGGSSADLTSSSTVALNTWQHVCITRDSNHVFRMFINACCKARRLVLFQSPIVTVFQSVAIFPANLLIDFMVPSMKLESVLALRVGRRISHHQLGLILCPLKMNMKLSKIPLLATF